MTTIKKSISICMVFVCLLSVFAIFAPIQTVEAAPNVTKTTSDSCKYTVNFIKDISLFKDTVRIDVKNPNGDKYYVQVAKRVNGGAWETYDANIICYDDCEYIGVTHSLKSKPTKVEYRFRTYQINTTSSGRQYRQYSSWSSIQTYTFNWSRAWYQLYSRLSITCVSNGLTKNYKTCIR